MVNRRDALRSLAGLFLSSPAFKSQTRPPGSDDPMFGLHNILDFRKAAKAKLDPVAWDYLDEGTEDEVALRDAREAFDRIILRPRFLRDVHKIDVTTSLFGKNLAHPIFICPAGGKNCFYPNGEQEVAKAAAASDTLMIVNGGIDELLNSGAGPKNWWQVTSGGQFRTRNTMLNFVERLEDTGCGGICFTVDIMHVSHRERSIHNNFVRQWCNSGVPRDEQGNLIYKPDDVLWKTGNYPSRPFPTPTWETAKRLRDETDLPIIIKGILTAEDTELCVKHGMSAVLVSSHGARQLDHVGGPIEAVPECVEAAAGKIPVLVDGGFRRGTDILKALALGATAIGIARPYLWGMTCFGQAGVERVIELLRTELALDMGLAGTASISDINRKLVRIRN